MATVNLNGKVISDDEVKNVLQAIADTLGMDINITSGDRTYVPPGGSTTSLHLSKRAADFHVFGVTDAFAFDQIKQNAKSIFATGNGYEFILHGSFTGTGGAHLHLGRYGTKPIGYVKCLKEGITAEGKNVYALDEEIQLFWGRDIPFVSRELDRDCTRR